MQDGVETGTAAKRKGSGDPSKNADMMIARMMVRALWQQDWSAVNPDAKAPDRKAAWKDARLAQMEKQLKPVRKALATMQRLGVTMTLSPKSADDASEDDDGAEA